MGLPWVRLDTQIASNPKILGLLADGQDRAVCAYMFALGYSGAHGLDGFIPKLALPMIHATAREAKALVAAGLWADSAGGWDINGWVEFQVSSDETSQRRERARLAAHKRWSADP